MQNPIQPQERTDLSSTQRFASFRGELVQALEELARALSPFEDPRLLASQESRSEPAAATGPAHVRA